MCNVQCKQIVFGYPFHRNEVISCLSEHVRNDTLLEDRHRIDKVCRKQLRVEVLERVRFYCTCIILSAIRILDDIFAVWQINIIIVVLKEFNILIA